MFYRCCCLKKLLKEKKKCSYYNTVFLVERHQVFEKQPGFLKKKLKYLKCTLMQVRLENKLSEIQYLEDIIKDLGSSKFLLQLNRLFKEIKSIYL